MLYLNQQQTRVKLLKCENECSFTETVMKNDSKKTEGKWAIQWDFAYILLCDLIREVVTAKWTKMDFKVVEIFVSFNDM